ncbi:TPA: hypothetical protein EYO63_04775 [Candidatus Poribacteria bacterium]|nr:hypothetical protein [Candidatus Poribacteria bacterium]HIC17502.1 hypothetical protein [Candidatus Poribacteria bacterium]HIO77456.1 hypothetical protein [Candidatus Poribacteria bacterium]
MPDRKYIQCVLFMCPDVSTLSLLHNDLWFTNTLFYQGKMYLVDFENGMFDGKEYDLASTYYSKPLRKVFFADDNLLACRIKRLEQIYQELSAI